MSDRTHHLHQITNYIESQFDLAPEKVIELLPSFLVALDNHMQNMDEKLEKDDLAGLKKMGHTMKGALLNLGLTELADIALRVEQYVGLSVNDPACMKLVSEIRSGIAFLKE